MDEQLRLQLCTEVLDLLKAWAVAEQKLANEWSGDLAASAQEIRQGVWSRAARFEAIIGPLGATPWVPDVDEFEEY